MEEMPLSKHKFECKFCNRKISASTLVSHLRSRHKYQFQQLMSNYEKQITKYEQKKCPCGKNLKRPKNWINKLIYADFSGMLPEKMLPKICNKNCKNLLLPWNKGKTKESNESIARYADSRRGLNNPFYTWSNDAEKVCKWKEKISISGKGRNLGLTLEEIYGEEKAKEIKRKQSISAKIRTIHGHTGKHHSEENKKLFARLAAEQLCKLQYKISKPQRKLFECLQKELGDELILEYKFEFYAIDIAYKNFAIEVDGDFYHANIEQGFEPKYAIQKRNLKNDKAKTTFLINRGWKIIRVWEHDINTNLEAVVSSLLKRLKNDE